MENLMRNVFRNLALLSISAVVCILLLQTPVSGSSAPINVEADHMTSTEKTGSVVFTGNVDAKQGDVRIRSDEMTVHYTKADKKNEKEGKEVTQQVEKLVCLGNVEVTRQEWLGTGKKMIYLSEERQVILIGNAKAWQGQNVVSGGKIIYYLDEGRSEVIGERTSTTLSGSADKGKKKKSRVNMTIIQK